MHSSIDHAAISFRAAVAGAARSLRVRPALASCAVVPLALALFTGTASAQAGWTLRASTNSNGEQGDDASQRATLSSDGRFVVFSSAASNLVTDDTNGVDDIFVKDLWTSLTTRVSVASGGAQANGASSDKGLITDDGRYVVFPSLADNLVAGDTNGEKDLFLRDIQLDLTIRVSVDPLGNQLQGASTNASITGDAQRIACDSTATNLWPGDANGLADIFVFDFATGQPFCASVTPTGEVGNGESLRPEISGDGRWVVFTSSSSDLVPNDTNGTWDTFLRDLQAGQTTRVSVDAFGNQANGMSNNARVDISDDGRFVVFLSMASNLVPNDTNGLQDVFVRDQISAQIERVNLDSSGLQAVGGGSAGCSMSADARYVAFGSYATNLVLGDTNDNVDVFVHDRLTGITERVSVSDDEQQANNASNNPRMSDDGRLVCFNSLADNLVPDDTNGVNDVFVRTRLLDCGWSIGSYCMSTINSTGKPARIGYQGTALISQNDLVLQVGDGVPFKPGIFFFGCYETQIPFGEGYLCVTGNQHRLAPVVRLDASGAGSFALDFTDPLSPASLIHPGSNWNFQFWYRDPQTVGHGFNLSDALRAQFCP